MRPDLDETRSLTTFAVDLIQLLGALAFRRNEPHREPETFDLHVAPGTAGVKGPLVFSGSEQARAFLASFRWTEELVRQLELAGLPPDWLDRLRRIAGEKGHIYVEFPTAEGSELPPNEPYARISTSGLSFFATATTVSHICLFQTQHATQARALAAIVGQRGVPAQSGSRRFYSITAAACLARASVVGGFTRFVMGPSGEERFHEEEGRTRPREPHWTVNSRRIVAEDERLPLLEEAGYPRDLAQALFDSGIYVLRRDEYLGDHLAAFALDGSEPDLVAGDDLAELEKAKCWLRDDGYLLIDRHYQALWPLLEPRPVAIYGRTHELPAHFEILLPFSTSRPIALFDTSAEGERDGEGLPEYLLRYRTAAMTRARRVTIPKIRIRSHRELGMLVQRVRVGLRNTGKALLLRGQPRHYELRRHPAVREMLYGDGEVDELSLPTSASRRSFDYDSFGASFQLQLQSEIYRDVEPPSFSRVDTAWLEGALHLSPFADVTIARRYALWRRLSLDYGWDVVVMGLAQHYGIPSHGLDLTSSLDVALFFALHRFDRGRYERLALREDLPDRQWPVVYLVATKAPLLHQLERIEQLGIEARRPQRQRAFLHYGGWGFHTNVCAEEVVAVAMLHPEFDAPELPTSRYLFPPPDEDPFYRRLLDLKDRASALGLEEGYRHIEEYRYGDRKDSASSTAQT